MNSLKNFPIEVLSNREAEQLFEKIVGDSARQSDFQRIGHEIVKRCGGLPVALNTIANALKNKSLLIWNDALDQIRNSNPREIHGMDANVYSSIELSYNFLESDEAKHLFLLCSLLRSCDCLYFSHLSRYGMGLGLFKKVHTLKSARNRVHRLIDSLKASCLLLDGDAEDEIKMHDIIFAVAVSIAEEKLMFNIQNISELKEEQINKNSTAISVPYNIQELPEERLEFPQLKFLLLRAEYGSSLQIPDFLFEGMKQLEVLNLTRFQLPSSLGCLINLQTLCLDSCQLQDIAMIGQLKKLEILSLRDSNIELLPTEIGQLRHLQLLDLTNCERLEVIPPNVISKLSRLEELYMGNSFTKWEKEEGGGNASLVELKGLSKLTTLDIHIPSAEIMPQDLVSVELERFWIYVGNELGWYNKYKTSRFMTLVGLGKITLLGMKMLVKRTEDLFLKEFKDLQNIVDELDNKEGFPRLKHLHIETCYEISHIISLVGQIPYKVFPLLESLSLHNLINLEKLCQGQLTDNQSFSNLMIINVTKCDRLKHIFSFSMAKNLLRLQKIEVGDCSNLEMIVGPDMEKSTTTLGYKKVISEDDSQVKVIFPSLEELKLVSLTSIENICRNLQYQNLKKVTLVDCKCLKYMFSYSMVNSLVQLEHLGIYSCESMEAVVVDTISTGLGGRDEGKFIEMVFPKLNYLRLDELPKLTSFAIGMTIHSVQFPSLSKLEITDCPNLKRFISMCSLDDNILTEMQPHHFFDEKVIFPSLEELELDSLTSMENIWHNQFQNQNLKKITLRNCKGLKYMFSYSMVNSFEQLEHLEIDRCKSMEAVVVDTISTGLGGRDEGKLIEMVFPKLNYLRLEELPKLTSFAIGMVVHSIEFPSLSNLRIVDCPNLIRFISMNSLDDNILTETQPHHFFNEKIAVGDCSNLEMIVGSDIEKSTTTLGYKKFISKDGSQVKVIFPSLEELKLDSLTFIENICHNLHFQYQNLKKVTLWNCTSLKYMFSYSMVNSLVQLEHLKIDSCESMEAVVVDTISTGLGGRDEGKLIEMVFPKLNYLGLKRLPKLISFVIGMTIHSIEFSSLSNITIINCPNLIRFISMSSMDDNIFIETQSRHFFDEKVIFPSLEELELDSLTSMENIWHNQFQNQNLKKITLRNCEGLKYMFSCSMVNSFEKLEHLNIQSCKSMEAVVVDTISTGLGGRDEGKLIKMVFPKLNYLGLGELPKLTSFAIGMAVHSIEFPSLSKLKIVDCPNLIRFISVNSLDDNILTEMQSRHFFDEKVRLPNLEELVLWSMKNLRQIWHHQLVSDSLRKLKEFDICDCEELISIFPPMVALPNLMTLDVGLCNGLRSLMTLSVAQSMVKLTSMMIFNCEKMEEIIQQELGEEVKDDRIVFTQLECLDLSLLTSLQSFCLGNYTLEFPSMERVSMSHCPNMKIFSQGVLLTPKLHQVDCWGEEYWEGNLNSIVQKMFEEMVGFHYTMNLRLSLHPRLKEIWHSQELPVSFFNELRFLEVDGCTDISSAIPIDLLWCLNNLLRLTVSNCDSLEVVLHLEEQNIDGHFGPFLPKLKYLGLINLPKLQRFCNFTGNIIALPSLTRMRIENCPNIEAFVSSSTSVHITANKEHQEMTLEENFLIDDIQPFFNENVAIPRLEELELSTMPKLFCLRKERLECSMVAQSWVSFQNLTTLEVSGSEGLMTLSTAESVVKLTMREMTQQVGEEVKTDIGLVFVHLKYLKLHHLPSLASFCVGNYILEFPSLLQFSPRE